MLSNISNSDMKKLVMIMVFYSLLSYFIAPLIGYTMNKKSESVLYGMIIGSILSIYLWINYGSKMVNI